MARERASREVEVDSCGMGLEEIPRRVERGRRDGTGLGLTACGCARRTEDA